MKSFFLAACWAWLALIFVASFLTWATIPTGTFSDLFSDLPAALPGAALVRVDAWSGNLTLLSFGFPNWLPFIAALSAVATVYARSRGADLLLVLPKLLLGYALLHIALFGFLVVAGSRASLGLGAFVTLFALLGLWGAITGASRQVTDALSSASP